MNAMPDHRARTDPAAHLLENRAHFGRHVLRRCAGRARCISAWNGPIAMLIGIASTEPTTAPIAPAISPTIAPSPAVIGAG